MRYYPELVFSIALSFFTSNAYASAWTQEQGNTLLIVTSSYYTANEMYDNNGHSQPQAPYHQYELNPYLEYGYRDDITLGSNLFLESATQNASSGNSSEINWGLGDSEFFLRKRLWQQDGFVVSAEPLVKLPSPQASASDQPKLGDSHTDMAMGFSGGYGFSAYGLNHFIDVDTQYRYRFGPQKDQVRVNASAGIGLTEHWALMPQAFLTYRINEPAVPRYTESTSDDYNLVRLQLSAVYALTPATSFQLGGFDDTGGKNVGEGKGVIFAIWKKI